MLNPPLLLGAVHVTAALPAPITTVGVPGAPGTVDGITAAVAADDVPVPTELIAATVKV